MCVFNLKLLLPANTSSGVRSIEAWNPDDHSSTDGSRGWTFWEERMAINYTLLGFNYKPCAKRNFFNLRIVECFETTDRQTYINFRLSCCVRTKQGSCLRTSEINRISRIRFVPNWSNEWWRCMYCLAWSAELPFGFLPIWPAGVLKREHNIPWDPLPFPGSTSNDAYTCPPNNKFSLYTIAVRPRVPKFISLIRLACNVSLFDIRVCVHNNCRQWCFPVYLDVYPWQMVLFICHNVLFFRSTPLCESLCGRSEFCLTLQWP